MPMNKQKRKRMTMNTKLENRVQEIQNTKTYCKEKETRKQITRKKKHVNRLQGRRNRKTDCNEEGT